MREFLFLKTTSFHHALASFMYLCGFLFCSVLFFPACLAFLLIIVILSLFWGSLLSTYGFGWNWLQVANESTPIPPARVSNLGKAIRPWSDQSESILGFCWGHRRWGEWEEALFYLIYKAGSILAWKGSFHQRGMSAQGGGQSKEKQS